MLFQSSALFTDLSVFENVAFPLREHTDLPEDAIRDLVLIKLNAVGLRGARDLLPGQLFRWDGPPGSAGQSHCAGPLSAHVRRALHRSGSYFHGGCGFPDPAAEFCPGCDQPAGVSRYPRDGRDFGRDLHPRFRTRWWPAGSRRRWRTTNRIVFASSSPAHRTVRCLSTIPLMIWPLICSEWARHDRLRQNAGRQKPGAPRQPRPGQHHVGDRAVGGCRGYPNCRW